MKTNFNSFLTPILLITLISGSLLSCRTAEVAVHHDLENDAEVFEVKGKQGSPIGQSLSFGDFKTSKIKRGWTFGYSIPFITKFQGAKEKLSFSQFFSNGNSAEVALVSKFRDTEYAPAKDYFSVSLNYKNYFAGGIKLNNSNDSWDLIVYSVDGASRSLKQNTSIGFVRNGDTQIDIKGIRELQGSSQFITQNDVYGYEFQFNGKTIGAVSTINNGKVWFKNGISDDLRLVLASVSSGLMLRNHVEDTFVTMID